MLPLWQYAQGIAASCDGLVKEAAEGIHTRTLSPRSAWRRSLRHTLLSRHHHALKGPRLPAHGRAGCRASALERASSAARLLQRRRCGEARGAPQRERRRGVALSLRAFVFVVVLDLGELSMKRATNY